MTDYTKLVEALRYCTDRNRMDCHECKYEQDFPCRIKLIADAADAIEELQAKVDRLTKENRELVADRPEMEEVNGHWEWKVPNDEQQLPKRGEWIHDVAVQGTTAGGVTFYHGYTCSVCGALMGRKGDAYCYKCGAKMEVQDG